MSKLIPINPLDMALLRAEILHDVEYVRLFDDTGAELIVSPLEAIALRDWLSTALGNWK